MHDLIVFGEDLGGLPSSTQHLVTRLARDRQVLWVNSIGLRQPRLCLKDLKRVYEKVFSRGRQYASPAQFTPVTSNMTQVNLLTIPAPRSDVARYLAKQLMLQQLKPLLRQLKLRAPLLWTSLPTAADLCGHLNESAVVYYCGDDFGALAGVDHQTALNHEQKLVGHAHLVLVASDTLKQKFPAAKTHLLPHGVDVTLFASPVPRAADLPDAVSGKQRPVAGFYGSLPDWLDYALLAEVVHKLPDWDFVFIGPNMCSTNPLPEAPNVFYLGPKPHHELPRYSQHWDVSMLPFRLNAQIEACNPLKLMEYMAAGRPIVTTEFPALAPYRSHLHCARDADAFVQALIRAKSASPIPKTLIEPHSWDKRSQFLSELLEQL